ncbi:MAG: type 1 glutamine amidotransferase [Rhodobacteraceae bacterium]|nr:type 1 glutamine amidotransferase [Alphaproteobacteria bacterium]NNF72674.1 type 1 glutamine amidotransferase [Paracoccaceae bacterium]NNK67009.1 type 1 glutamine amidotransferase [Paracoccaceae bacterium]
MKIGILQSGHLPEAMRETLGDYSEMYQALLAGQGLEFTTYNVCDMEFPESATSEDGWLISGSRHGAYDDLPFIARLEDLIREAHAAGVPMVGICFGHQIIAQALGGKVEKFAGGWAVGPQVYEFGDTPLTLNAWHQDQVTDLPPGATPIATHPFCANAGFVLGDHILTVQPHPEFDDAAVASLVDQRGRGLIPDDLLAETMGRLGTPNDNQEMADRIGRFFREARHDALA